MDQSIGIIDLGSNTIRLAVYRHAGRGMMVENDNIKRVVRLISHVQADGLIDDAGVRETIDCLRQFKELCDARHVSEIIGVATAGVRQAKNGQALLAKIEADTGIRMRLLSGEEEAYYGYLAVVNSMAVKNAYCVDIGGASTEVTLIQGRKRIASVSFPFGAVTLTKQFFRRDVPESQELKELHTFLEGSFRSHPWIGLGRGFPVVAVGGSARNLAKMRQRQRKYSLDSLHHYELTSMEVDELYQAVRQAPLESRKQIEGLSSDRADIIVGGVAILRCLMEASHTERLLMSNKGLRDGILFERMLNRMGTNLIDDVLEFSAEQFMTRYHVNEQHSRHVRYLATSLFDQLTECQLIALGPIERQYLGIAAQLYDIGRSINVHDSSQHTFYLLSNVLLMGVPHRERLIIAMMSSYKSGKQLQQQMSDHADIIPKSDRALIEQLGLLVLLARTLDRSMTQQVHAIHLHELQKQVVVECIGERSDLVEYLLVDEVLRRMSKCYRRPFTLRVKTGPPTEELDFRHS